MRRAAKLYLVAAGELTAVVKATKHVDAARAARDYFDWMQINPARTVVLVVSELVPPDGPSGAFLPKPAISYHRVGRRLILMQAAVARLDKVS